MKAPARKPAAGPARETAALLSSFCMVRILHYAASALIQPFSLLERLRSRGCPVAPATLNRILFRMERNRWLRRRTSSGATHPSRRTYALTSKGRKALHLARKRLKVLATLQPTKS